VVRVENNWLSFCQLILAAFEQRQPPSPVEEEGFQTVSNNEDWRGKECVNLLAPEAPTTLTVRSLLSSEVGIRAAE
jgi:glycine hydroxymethyltransferase